MKGKYWAVIIVVVLLLIIAYAGRHRIRALFSSPSQPTEQMTVSQPSSPEPTTTQASSSAELNNGIVMTATSQGKGTFLTNPKGMSLYTFDKDTANKSNCAGSCATLWPAYTAKLPLPDTLPANMAVTKRADGSMQYTWNGMPLYYYSQDKQPGDTLGDGVGNLWHLAKPS